MFGWVEAGYGSVFGTENILAKGELVSSPFCLLSLAYFLRRFLLFFCLCWTKLLCFGLRGNAQQVPVSAMLSHEADILAQGMSRTRPRCSRLYAA